MNCNEFRENAEKEEFSEQMQEHLQYCKCCQVDYQLDCHLDRWISANVNEEIIAPVTLWGKIESELPHIQAQNRKSKMWKGLLSIPALKPVAAMALVLSIVGPGAFVYTVNQAYDLNSLTESTLRELESAEQRYLDEIEKLGDIVGDIGIREPNTLYLLYTEKLIVLDEIIAECQEALNDNELNMNVRTYLLTAYKEKASTLEAISKLVLS